MRFYFDKENVVSLVKSKDAEFYNDIVKIFKRQAYLTFNFEKEEIRKNELVCSFISNFYSGRGVEEKIGCKNNIEIKNSRLPIFNSCLFPARPLKSNLHTSLHDCSYLKDAFLLSDQNCKDVVKEGALAIQSVGEESKLFDQLCFWKSDYDFDKKILIGGEEYRCWNDLSKYAMPFTDLILIDKFVFVEKGLIKCNYIECLKALHVNVRVNTNIIVYTDYDVVIKNKTKDDILEFIEYIRNETIRAVRSITGVSPTFTLVLVRDTRGVESLAEHDRGIWTNYFRVYTGDSINHFDNKGEKITKGREIQFSSHLKKENRDLSNILIADLQQNIKKLGKKSDQIKGNRVCNFIKFT